MWGRIATQSRGHDTRQQTMNADTVNLRFSNFLHLSIAFGSNHG
jgi:hypothetical protein